MWASGCLATQLRLPSVNATRANVGYVGGDAGQHLPGRGRAAVHRRRRVADKLSRAVRAAMGSI